MKINFSKLACRSIFFSCCILLVPRLPAQEVRTGNLKNELVETLQTALAGQDSTELRISTAKAIMHLDPDSMLAAQILVDEGFFGVDFKGPYLAKDMARGKAELAIKELIKSAPKALVQTLIRVVKEGTPNSREAAIEFLSLIEPQAFAKAPTVLGTDSYSLTPVQNRSDRFLRYGTRTPHPSNLNELAIQQGFIGNEIKKVGGGHIDTVLRGILLYHNDKIEIIIKPDDGVAQMEVKDNRCVLRQPRANIPLFTDNRRADAAFHLNKFINMVDTPEHVIRDDVPIDLAQTRLGGAGVQILSVESVTPNQTEIDALRENRADRSVDLLKELEDIAVFDTLIGNTDRHDENWRFRQNPKPGQRHIVAIDHTLSFPVSNDHVWGNYHMIEWYINSSKSGVISEENLAKLDILRSRRKEVDQILGLNLEQRAIDLLWRRLERMRMDKKVFVP